MIATNPNTIHNTTMSTEPVSFEFVSRSTPALTPALSPKEREGVATLLKNFNVPVAIPAALLFLGKRGEMTEASPLPVSAKLFPLSWGRGPG